MSSPRSIAVVGAGLAAVSTCDALRAQGYDGELTLYSADHGLPYDRPPLSKDVLLGRARREDVSLRPEKWYEEQMKAARRLVDRRVAVDAGRLADESVDLRVLLR